MLSRVAASIYIPTNSVFFKLIEFALLLSWRQVSGCILQLLTGKTLPPKEYWMESHTLGGHLVCSSFFPRTYSALGSKAVMIMSPRWTHLFTVEKQQGGSYYASEVLGSNPTPPNWKNTLGRTQQSCGLSKVKLSEVSFQKQVQITGLIFLYIYTVV